MAVVAPPQPFPTTELPTAARTRVRAPGFDLLFTLVFALFGWGVGIERLSDNSFFWHLRTGGLILDHGIPHSDVFSYTASGHPWVAQSWLAEVLYAGLDRAAGPFAIRVLGGLVGMAIAVLAFRLALHLARDRVRAAGVTVAALAGLYTLWSERPLLMGVLLLVGLLWVVEARDSWVGRHPLVALPVLFWLWANVHGTFALGFAYLGLHFLGRWLEGHRPWQGPERPLLVGTVLGFVACFLNPYGARLVTFPVDLMRRGDALRGVIEWSSPDFHSVRGLSFALWIAVFVVVVARAPRGRVGVRDLVVTVPFLVLGLWALRNVAIAPLVCLPVAARAVATPVRRRDDPVPLGRLLAGLVVAVIVLMGLRAAAKPDFALDSYPVRAMAAVERQGLLGRRLLTDDADAGYVILRSWPEQRVFMDDRFDMFPMSVIRDFGTVNGGNRGWDRVLRERDVEVVVWGRDRVLSQLLLQRDDWHVVHRDADYYVFVRD
ncbi:MAG TPA: hypothetical protein VIH82_05885 [Acidimicrobiia bacterium]|jgi:hypothetical protein